MVVVVAIACCQYSLQYECERRAPSSIDLAAMLGSMVVIVAVAVAADVDFVVAVVVIDVVVVAIVASITVVRIS